MTYIHKGRCQCGAVEYEFTGSPRTVHACHCSKCQKRSGSAFGLTMVVGKDSFVLNGEVTTFVRISDSSQSVTSHFCPKYRNPIYGELERFPYIIAIKPGTLDDTNWFNLGRHIWTDSAQNWFQFPEGCEASQKGRW